MKTKLILIVLLITALAAVATGIAWAQTNSVATPAETRKALYYTCSMHPSVKADKPGDCPICGMKLIPVYADATGKTNVLSAEIPDACCGVSCPMMKKP